MAETRSGGSRIWFTTDGRPDGPPLLLSNSLGTTAELWDDVVAHLGDRFRIIRYDQRGHGRSAVPPAPYSLSTLGGDAIAVLDAAGVSRAHVAGISLGGITALWLGIHLPDRVGSLILANTGAKIGTPELWNERIAAVERDGMQSMVDGLLGRWFTPGFRRDRPDQVDRFRRMLEECPPTGYLGCSAAVRDADLRSRLDRVRAPTLVIVGTADPATPPALGELLRDGIAGARLEALDTAHLSNVERPEAFARITADFLEAAEDSHG